EQLAASALRGDPPEVIAEELRDVLEQAHSARHLAVRGVRLARTEMQLSVAGPAIGLGFAPTKDVIRRIEATERLLARRAEQRSSKKFNPLSFETFLSVPRAASFAVTIRVGSDQLSLFDDSDGAESVIRETMDLLRLHTEDRDEEVRRRIDNDEYFQT